MNTLTITFTAGDGSGTGKKAEYRTDEETWRLLNKIQQDPNTSKETKISEFGFMMQVGLYAGCIERV